jgi:hypothetical protein
MFFVSKSYPHLPPLPPPRSFLHATLKPMNSHRTSFSRKAVAYILGTIFILSPLSVLAVNPPQPFSPSDNILDPNCLPTDSNCYVAISNLSLTSATATNLTATHATTTSLSILGDASLAGSVSILGATSTVTENVVTTVVPSVRTSYPLYNDSDKQLVVSPVDGFVRFVYFDQTTWNKLYLVRCLDNDCLTSATTTVVTDSNEPEFATIALGPDNLPRIAYMTYASPSELHYVQCLNESCSSNTNQVVATSSPSGWFYEQSLAVDQDGFARIVYNDGDSSSTLKLIQCTNASCSTKTSVTIVNPTGGYFNPVVAVDTNNLTHVAYTNYLSGSSTLNSLYYASCADTACSSHTTNLIDSMGAGYSVSLALTQTGLPRIAYRASLSGNSVLGVKYATCSDALCATSTITTITNKSATFYFTSILVDNNDLARFVYSSRDSGATYVQCLNASCTSSKTSVPVSDAWYPTTIAMGQDGLPRILAATNSGHDFSVIRLVADDGRALTTGSSIGSFFKSLGELFATRVTTSLLDVKGSAIVAEGLHVGGQLAVDGALSIANTASSSEGVTGTINMGGVPFIHNYGAGTDGAGLKSSIFIGVDAGNFNITRTGSPGNYWYGNYNLGIGDHVLKNLTYGFSNVVVGGNSLVANTTGSANQVFGRDSLSSNTIGGANVAIGAYVLPVSVKGSNNTAVGSRAGVVLGSSATSSENVFLGYQAAYTQLSGDNNIAIGASSSLPSLTGSNQLAISNFLFGTNINSPTTGKLGIGTTTPAYTLSVGNTSITGVVARFQNSTGYCDINPTTTSLTCTSDIRLKKNIVTLDASTTLATLTKLNPVTYNWLAEDNASSTHAGFIAQEVKPLFPDLVSTDANGTLSVAYSGFIPYIIQSIKELASAVLSFKESFTTKNLCVGEGEQKTCITKEQLDTLLQAGKATASQSIIQPLPTESATTESVPETATTTEVGSGVATMTEEVQGGQVTADDGATTTLVVSEVQVKSHVEPQEVASSTGEVFPDESSTDILSTNP